jgi:hypothetical protein
MNGSGCKNCPVNPCETTNYRGSTCAAQRAKFGLGDPQTNADRIRAMPDGELAMILTFGIGCVNGKPHCMEVDCTPCMLNWLKQPVKGDAE